MFYLVIHSLCGEVTCLAILEAMVFGCAVLATNMGGTITQIINGHNGMLCWPDHEPLLASLLRLIDFPKERLQLQKAGWETSQQAFSLQQWEDRWTTIIQEVTKHT